MSRVAVGGSTLLTLTLTLAFAFASSHARAQPEDAEPIAIVYDAPQATCPDERAFFREVTSRTSRARSARAGEKARVLHVALVKTRDAFTGRLLIEEASTWSSAREVSGATCVEVVEALGLVAALAVDPKASTAARPLTAAPATPTSERDADPTPTPTSAPPPAPVVVDTPSPPPPPLPRSPPSRSRARFGAGAQVDGSFVADLVFAGRLFGELELLRDASLFAPSIRVALARSLDVDRQPTVGSASLRWTQAALEGCPLRISIASAIAARPCLGIAAGVIDAEGTNIGSARSRSRPWSTVSAQGRLVWEPIYALMIELEGGGLAPLFREDFFFEPGVPIYKAPSFAAFARAGASVRFP